eukprot:842078-Alexandrium_andersonii.AAC.1
MFGEDAVDQLVHSGSLPYVDFSFLGPRGKRRSANSAMLPSPSMWPPGPGSARNCRVCPTW